MKSGRLAMAALLFFPFYCPAQTFQEKREIYEVLLKTFAVNNVPVMNETFTRIYKYDIDGNYDKWFYQGNNQKSGDTSALIGRVICVSPIKYSQLLISFLDSQNITTKDFANRIDNKKLDSLKNYVSDERIVSWKRAPLANSPFANVFKKKKVMGFSSILFYEQNKIAVVKMQIYSKSRAQSNNPSKIIILGKVGMEWKVIRFFSSGF